MPRQKATGVGLFGGFRLRHSHIQLSSRGRGTSLRCQETALTSCDPRLQPDPVQQVSEAWVGAQRVSDWVHSGESQRIRSLCVGFFQPLEGWIFVTRSDAERHWPNQRKSTPRSRVSIASV